MTRPQPVRVVQIVGARPQFIKLAPLSHAFAQRTGVEELIVHTGQHYDPQLSDVFFQELGIPEPAANLEVGSGSHGRQTATMLERIETVLLERRPDVVVVYGDTNSTLAGALAAVKLQIPVAHVEAGLRSRNRAMPEELNRVATDHLCDLLLAPTLAAMTNLDSEGLIARSRMVGDVMYDAVLANAAVARAKSKVLQQLALSPMSYGVVTVHRAESTTRVALEAILGILSRIADTLVPLILPLHPRTRAALREGFPHWRPPARLVIIDPLGPMDMLRLTEAAAVVVTDSGGLQKEAFMLGSPCVTLRTETEWVETVAAGANAVVGLDTAAALAAVSASLERNDESRAAAVREAHALYGRGEAAVNSVGQILELVDRSASVFGR